MMFFTGIVGGRATQAKQQLRLRQLGKHLNNWDEPQLLACPELGPRGKGKVHRLASLRQARFLRAT
jgi:hypothetical protein